VTPDQNIFCNAAWYELQIYWDGSFGICCAESHKLYPDNESEKYNLKSMTIREWINSEPVKNARASMLGVNPNSFCSRCYREEQFAASSKRTRANQKSVIFTKSNFDESFQQSPHYKVFDQTHNTHGHHDGMPVELHIDLGNYCNLACKMCAPQSSSSIAVQHVKWGINNSKKYIGTDWTKDQQVWQRTLEEIVSIPNLKNIHFMGGETLLTKRFEDFIDFFIAAKRFDVGFAFVSNGTVFNLSLLNKLKQFRRVGIEISVETATAHNTYQRQGTDTAEIFKNIDRYLDHCNNTSITVTVRPAISALTIGYYSTLLEYCFDKKILVKSLICTEPKYYDPTILPDNIKRIYLQKYYELKEKYFSNVGIANDFNESNPTEYARSIVQQIDQCVNLLTSPPPMDQQKLLSEMVHWCKKWDQVRGYNARDLYPEFLEILNQYGY
jgi:pyruvate-formate lyase-activating enzyme